MESGSLKIKGKVVCDTSYGRNQNNCKAIRVTSNIDIDADSSVKNMKVIRRNKFL